MNLRRLYSLTTVTRMVQEVNTVTASASPDMAEIAPDVVSVTTAAVPNIADIPGATIGISPTGQQVIMLPNGRTIPLQTLPQILQQFKVKQRQALLAHQQQLQLQLQQQQMAGQAQAGTNMGTGAEVPQLRSQQDLFHSPEGRAHLQHNMLSNSALLAARAARVVAAANGGT